MTTMRSSLWIGTGAAGVLALAAAWQAGFTLAPGSLPLATIVGIAAAICWFRPPERFGALRPLVELLEGFVLLTVMSVVGALFAYTILHDTQGFADPLLARADRAIGFDWPATFRFVAARPVLHALLFRAYLAFAWLPFLVFGLLYRAGRTDRIYRYVLAQGLALSVTLGIFCFLPARAAFAYYRDAGMRLAPELSAYDATIAGLRDGSLTVIDLTRLDGLVTFPSFHAAMAILFTWAAWPAGRWWRGPLVVVNALMWLSAVPVGGHYAVDLIAGTLVATGAIVLSGRWSQEDHAAVVAAALPAIAGCEPTLA